MVRSVRPLKVSLNSSETCRITDFHVRKYRCLSEEPFITLATVVGGDGATHLWLQHSGGRDSRHLSLRPAWSTELVPGHSMDLSYTEKPCFEKQNISSFKIELPFSHIFFFSVSFLFFFSPDRVSLCSPGLPASASKVLGLKACTATAQQYTVIL